MEISPAVFYVKNPTLENSATARTWSIDSFSWYVSQSSLLLMLCKNFTKRNSQYYNFQLSGVEGSLATTFWRRAGSCYCHGQLAPFPIATCRLTSFGGLSLLTISEIRLPLETRRVGVARGSTVIAWLKPRHKTFYTPHSTDNCSISNESTAMFGPRRTYLKKLGSIIVTNTSNSQLSKWHQITRKLEWENISREWYLASFLAARLIQ